jgi:hypothetical protein
MTTKGSGPRRSNYLLHHAHFRAGRPFTTMSLSFPTMYSLKSLSVGETWPDTCWSGGKRLV